MDSFQYPIAPIWSTNLMEHVRVHGLDRTTLTKKFFSKWIWLPKSPIHPTGCPKMQKNVVYKAKTTKTLPKNAPKSFQNAKKRSIYSKYAFLLISNHQNFLVAPAAPKKKKIFPTMPQCRSHPLWPNQIWSCRGHPARIYLLRLRA